MCERSSALDPVGAVNFLLEEISAMNKHVPTDLEADLWQEVIRECGPTAVARALRDHVGRSAFMPKPGEIRAYLGASGTTTSALAWELVREAVRSVGPYSSPAFVDPAIVLAITKLGGWVAINECMQDPQTDRFGYDALFKRFDVAFGAARADIVRNAAPVPLLRGLHSLSASDGSSVARLDRPRGRESVPGGAQ